MIDLKQTNQVDPLTRNVEHGLDEMKGSTPFDPPSVYDEDKKGTVNFDAMPEALKELLKK